MDFFHWTTKIVSRNKGKSAVAAAAYISGTRILSGRNTNGQHEVFQFEEQAEGESRSHA